MLKHEIIEAVATVSGKSKKDVRTVFEAAAAVTRAAIAQGQPVMLLGLGQLKLTKRGPRKARNIHTCETVIVPPRTVVLFSPSTSLTAAANKNAV